MNAPIIFFWLEVVLNRVRLLLAFALPLMLALSVFAGDQSNTQPNVSGNWQLSWQGRQGTQQGTLQLQQDGSKITGTMQGPRGSIPVSGSLDGNKISLNMQFQGRRRSVTVAFTGSVDNDAMNGTVKLKGGGRRFGGGGGGQSHTWTATRQQAGATQPDQGASNSQ
jgi:hypothetical protein